MHVHTVIGSSDTALLCLRIDLAIYTPVSKPPSPARWPENLTLLCNVSFAPPETEVDNGCRAKRTKY